MKRSLADILACPRCAAPLVFEAGPSDAGRAEQGWLRCGGCARAWPICAGFPLFGEGVAAGEATPDLGALETRLFGAPERYADFVREKHRRPVRDMYAAFTPFNEPNVGLLRFASLLRRDLAPGDRILDLWCRTGWTGELLAALFPEQTVVSLWEQNVDVLGYRGFRFWLPEGARAANLEILFHHPDEPLPFARGAFAAVHGLDTLHRYDLDRLTGEVLRVARDDAPIVFPHVHLANAEPDPWFDRGCTIRHGREYAARLGERAAGSGRRAFVLSERALFERDDVALADDCETSHYNGLVALVPPDRAGATLAAEPPTGDGAARPIAHPMLLFDLHAATVALDESRLDGEVGRLLDRHPIQRAALRAHAPARLERVECEILHGARAARTLDEIATATARPREAVVGAAEAMAARGWIALQPVSEAMARLQHFFAEQAWVAPRAAQTVNALFDEACARHAERPLVRVDADGSVFRYADAAEVVGRVAARLRQAGVGPGDRVGLVAPFSTEAALALWGCLRAGAVLVPIDATRPAPFAREALARAGARLVFCDPASEAALAADGPPRVVLDDSADGPPRVVLDDSADALDDAGDAAPRGDAPAFADWLESADGDESPAPVSPDAPALVLHTSGTTGHPKALTLSHGSLFRSGATLARTWGWGPDDVLASTGDLHAMSGARNPCVAVLHAGASFLALEPKTRANPVALAEALGRGGATLLSTTPAALGSLLRFEARIPRHALHALRQVVCTGAALAASVAEAFEARFDASVHDYYGLTETGGVCIGTPPGEKREGIGRPLDCVARIASPEGEALAPGEAGELWVLTENRAEPGPGAADGDEVVGRDGWCRTGDLAVRDEAGRIRLLGRRREIVKDARGELVSPAEIEAVLLAHDAVEAAGVCGFRDEDGNERIAAYFVARAGAPGVGKLPDALRRLALERLGPGRVPARVECVDRLPLGSDGALLRGRLAAVAARGVEGPHGR
ncbi:MAG TPA: AMP-binding protein [Myxococcota bacterium]|nr:AMP-binding protein [Myxococcota bacterium]